MSIRYKMLIPMLLLTFITAAALLGASVYIFNDYVEGTTQSELEGYQNVVVSHIDDMHSMATTSTGMIASDSRIQAALVAGDREALIARATELQAQTGVEFCTITDAEGNVLARSHDPGNFGDSVASQKNIAEALDGNSFTGIETGTAVKLSIRSGAPVYTAEGAVAGAVSTGYRLDQDTFVDRMKAIIGSEVTIFLGDERISTTVVGADGARAVGTTADPVISAQVLGGTPHYGKAAVVGHDAFVNYSPLKGADGGVVGMTFVGKYTVESVAATYDFFLRGGIIALIILVVATPLIIILARRTVLPVHAILKAAETIAEGDVDVFVEVNTRDEMKALADSFNRMVAEMKRQSRDIAQVAGGDLSGEVNVRSGKDAVGIALRSMLEMNNEIFAMIIEASKQVSGGAMQMADGAQNLAQGSTEQAASIEELSAAISLTYEKTRVNTRDAGEALEIINRVGELMNGSMSSMNEMLTAMAGISEASDRISRIIKVIDDIAFQTNILALNAAVEAARAGQHGKGFAVVADEVRNLAAKSAAAARETSELIAGSASRVTEGNQIVERTNESLKAVAECAQRNAEAINKISSANLEQEKELSRISEGIQQISAVVQANSATAEESAATSEEMSSQSSLLTELVSRFKLREADAANPGPRAENSPAPRIPANTGMRIDYGDADKY
ncbi:MAG: methyl-accepting chemotaxis protein [Oscillospiraceae bacterium]|nr:methyl-accepting chemotaxis protein [Oscillospiraceae bacterium]